MAGAASFSTQSFILLLDTPQQHTSDQLWVTAREVGIRLVVVPPNLTWLLQPCDVMVFAYFKSVLMQQYRRLRASYDTPGSPTTVQWLKCIGDTILQVVYGKDWGRAFRRTGYGVHLEDVSNFVRSHLTKPFMPPATDPLADAEIICLFHARRRVWHRGYVRIGLQLPVGDPPLPPLAAPGEALPVPLTEMDQGLVLALPKPARPVFITPKPKAKGKGKAMAKGKAKAKAMGP